MQHLRIPTLIALLWALTACGGSTAGDITPPPDSLLPACGLPISLPHRELTQAEVEIWWGRDRSALRDCAARHELLAEWALGQIAAN